MEKEKLELSKYQQIAHLVKEYKGLIKKLSKIIVSKLNWDEWVENRLRSVSQN